MKKRLFLGLALLGAGLCLWLGGTVTQLLVEQRLARRLGAPVDLGRVWPGLQTQRIRNLVVGSPGSSIDLRVNEVDVFASPLDLLMSGLRGVARVRIKGVTGSVNTAKLAAPVMPDRGAPARTSGRGPAPSTGGRPQIVVEAVDVAISDNDGQLLRLKCGQVTGTPRRAALFDAALTVYEKAAQLSFTGVALSAKATDVGPRLEQGVVEELVLRIVPRRGAPFSLARLRVAASALRAVVFPQRVSDAAPGVGSTASPRRDDHGAPRPPAWARLLGEDADLEVAEARIEIEEEGAVRSLLSGATVRVTGGGGQISSKGGGVAVGGGRIAWDLDVGTAPLSVRGDVDVTALPLALLAGAFPQLPWYQPERGRIDARLQLRTESVGHIRWDGELKLSNVALQSHRIAPEPVTGIDFSLVGRGAFRPLARRLEVAKGHLVIGDARLDVQGAAAVHDNAYQLAIDAILPATGCEAAVKAIPEGLLGELRQARFDGKIAGRLHLRLDSEALEDTELEMGVRDHCRFLEMPQAASLRRFQAPFVHSVVEPDGSVFEMVTGPGTPGYTYLEDISPFLVHAVLAHEDTRFFFHSGFSPLHIRNALVRNLQEGRYVVGASTISMQLVKNILLHREKTLARKLQEVLLTWYVERMLDKQEILELYLNVIEYGPAVYGIEHASQYYFKRSPSELSPAEAAFFATILPAPKRFHRYYEQGALSHSGLERVRSLVRRLGARGSYDEDAVQYALQELEDFHFVKNGQEPLSRTIVGQAQPLPYQPDYWSAPDWGMTTTNHVVDPGLGYPIPQFEP